MLGLGFHAQRLANSLFGKLARKQTARPPATVGRPPIRQEIIHFIDKKMLGGLPNEDLARVA